MNGARRSAALSSILQRLLGCVAPVALILGCGAPPEAHLSDGRFEPAITTDPDPPIDMPASAPGDATQRDSTYEAILSPAAGPRGKIAGSGMRERHNVRR